MRLNPTCQCSDFEDRQHSERISAISSPSSELLCSSRIIEYPSWKGPTGIIKYASSKPNEVTFPLHSPLVNHIWSAGSRSGTSRQERQTYWHESRKGQWKWLRLQHFTREGEWRVWVSLFRDCSIWRREGSGKLYQCVSIFDVGKRKKPESDSPQWSPLKGQDEMDTPKNCRSPFTSPAKTDAELNLENEN